MLQPERPARARAPDNEADAANAAGSLVPTAVAELDSQSLLAGLRRRVIIHQGERYCLQLTRAGKLLLTK